MIKYSYQIYVGFKSELGFSLVEVILAVSIFSLVATVFAGAIIYGQQSTQIAGEQVQAGQLAEEAIEAVRNIRDENYNNLQDGSFGLVVENNTWALSGSSDINGIFTRQINISTVSTSTKEIIATVTWQQNAQRTGSISVLSRLANWKGD